MTLQIGDLVPDLPLPSSQGKPVSLHDFKGRSIVLYFYPKDDTPGCTREACDFRDQLPRFKDLNAVIIGVSKDPLTSHDKFIQKYGLPFILVSDAEKQWMDAFGVWQEKTLYGKLGFGVVRSTFLIGPDSTLVKAWRSVKVDGHVEKVLESLQNL